MNCNGRRRVDDASRTQRRDCTVQLVLGALETRGCRHRIQGSRSRWHDYLQRHAPADRSRANTLEFRNLPPSAAAQVCGFASNWRRARDMRISAPRLRAYRCDAITAIVWLLQARQTHLTSAQTLMLNTHRSLDGMRAFIVRAAAGRAVARRHEQRVHATRLRVRPAHRSCSAA